MSNALKFSLLALSLLAAGAQAADPIQDRQRAALAGHYVLEGVADAGSELELRPDGRFEWSLSYGLMVESASGIWNVGADRVVLTMQAPAEGKPLFSLDQVLPWNQDAQRRLEEFAQEQRDAMAERACGFAQTYRLGLAQAETEALVAQPANDPADPAHRAAAEAALTPELAALERSRLAVEAAAATAIKRKAGSAAAYDPLPPPMPSATDAAAAAAAAAANEAKAMQSPGHAAPVDEMEAADRAVRAYLRQYQRVGELHALAGRAPPQLRQPQFDTTGCLPPSAAAKPSGYAVVVGDPQRGYRAEGIGVEFVYSDGRSASAQTSPGGWALALQRPGARLQRVVLQAPDRPSETLALDEGQGRVFAIRLDTAAARPPSFEQMILTQDDGDLISPQIRGRYVRQ
ncbi:hypothetical protein ASE35_10235 [Lysobacter sp. Root916]|uniref:hypothetical protein n=1 Tax=Lysobacter sp. Root916 TaxID=1736606 RepID=UPI00070B021E|nr:hypothetical protein [Lysobacter sp. Root916]KRD34110.1 hypothetical protein ASE35_10235 [Lysobacter sp. Root916]